MSATALLSCKHLSPSVVVFATTPLVNRAGPPASLLSNKRCQVAGAALVCRTHGRAQPDIMLPGSGDPAGWGSQRPGARLL